MRFLLTENLTIPAGTVFETSGALGEGGLEAKLDDDRILLRVFVGETRARREGVVVAAGQRAHIRAVG